MRHYRVVMVVGVVSAVDISDIVGDCSGHRITCRRAKMMAEWISVKDGLPEEGEVILTRDKYGHLRDRTLKRVGKTMLFTPDGMEPIRHITHWMPMPLAPEDMK